MAIITNYVQQDDGTTTVVVKGVDLSDKDFLLLDNDLEVECEVDITDPYQITDKQRRKIFAMLRDIYDYFAQPIEYLRYMFQKQLELLNGYEPI